MRVLWLGTLAGIIGGIPIGIMMVRVESTFVGVLVPTAISAITTRLMPPLPCVSCWPTVSSGGARTRSSL